MQGESSSAESKVTASSCPGRYKCGNCSRVFKTSRARGGHQIAHRKARELRGKPYGPVLAAVLIHHIPSDDEVEKEPEGEAEGGTGFREDPLKMDDETGINPRGNERKAKPKAKAVPVKPRVKSITRSSQGRRANKKPVGDEEKSDEYHDDHHHHHHHHYHKQHQKKELCTRDFLGQWNPMSNDVTDGVGGAEAFEGSPWKVTLDLAARVLGEGSHDDDLNLELQLCSNQKVEKVDLELKLGF